MLRESEAFAQSKDPYNRGEPGPISDNTFG
jgi:hypothetical protein